MGYGVIVKHLSNVTKAQFYVPIIKPGLPSKSSHVFYNEDFYGTCPRVDIDHIPRTTTIIVRLPHNVSIEKLVGLLKKLPHKFAISAPIEEDFHYWCTLRDARSQLADSQIELLLDFKINVSTEFLQRFKCLQYSAIILSKQSIHGVSDLLCKPTRPDLLVDQNIANQANYDFWRQLAHPRLDPALDMLIDPLQPLTQDMELEVYETFEKDKIKYTQYGHAIELAIEDLKLKKSSLKILIIGAGRGPLLKLASEKSTSEDLITVYEKNSKCLASLALLSKGKSNVTVHHEDIRNLKNAEEFDLVISELLGSFGCNEACPEILQMFANSKAVIIPESYHSLLRPIYCSLNVFSKYRRPYLIKLSASFSVSKPAITFSFTHPGNNKLSLVSEMIFNGDENEMANGLCGYFEATLYGPYRIGNDPSLGHLERCTSWFPLVFPMSDTRYPIRVKMARVSATDLRYLWEVNGATYGHSTKLSTHCDYRILL